MITQSTDTAEMLRHERQLAVDRAKTQKERNKMGQFSTPFALAKEIVTRTVELLPYGMSSVRFLEPALGSGVF